VELGDNFEEDVACHSKNSTTGYTIVHSKDPKVVALEAFQA